MKISEITIKRPVLSVVLSLVVVLIGLVAYDRLPVREYPNIDEPTVSVTTLYEGASPEIIETEVTKVIEDGLSGIEGIKTIKSKSRQEVSEISITFQMDRDADDAAAEVRDRVGRVRADLPGDIEEPVIAKVEADAEPIIYLAFSSDQHTMGEISDYVERYVTDQIELISGVAKAQIFGSRRYAMRIWLDPQKMAARNITPQDVENAIRAQNLEVPGGRIESLAREFTVLSDTDLNTPEQFENIVLRNVDGYLVRLKDVGRAEIGAEKERENLRHNGESAVAIGVVKQSTANPLEISTGLNVLIVEIQKELPKGMKISVVYDSSIFIERSIDNVFTTIIEAVLLVLLIIFLFLRNVRATLIPLVTIPVSLIGAFSIMWALGFTINTLTLLALVLAVGLVVDDAIVVLENIHRHVENGVRPMQAAIKGIREIGFAVVVMTFTLAAVFIPVALTEGRTGKLFTEFALTLAGAVIVSGFVALTLSPMMCSKFLRHETVSNRVSRWMENFLNDLDVFYRKALAASLKTWVLGASVALFSGGATFFLFNTLPSELSPIEDRGVLVGVFIAPDGASVEYTEHYSRMVEEIFYSVPEQTSVFNVSGYPVVSEGIIFVELQDWQERERSQQSMAAELAPRLFGVPGVLAFAINLPSLGQPGLDQPIQFVVKSPDSYAELNSMVGKLMAEIRNNPQIKDARTDLKLNAPELRLSINRDKAADLGVDVAAVGRAVETMMGGRDVTRFKIDGEQYDVIVKVEEDLRTTPDDLKLVHVRTNSSDMIPLSNLVTIQEGVTAQSLNHFDRSRAVIINANITPGYSLGEALAYLQDAAQRVMPENSRIDYAGQSREFMDSSGGLLLTFILALAFIYLMLAAQFESFVDPFIILLSVPLSMVGALLALKLTGNTLNIYSQVGLITLIGLITKHGIMMVEFANQLQEQGMKKLEAIIEAATLRLRPILMTTAATVLGAVPLALASGAGAESRHQLGWVIVGGMTVGTALTLLVVPVAYKLIAKKREQVMASEETDIENGQPLAEPETV